MATAHRERRRLIIPLTMKQRLLQFLLTFTLLLAAAVSARATDSAKGMLIDHQRSFQSAGNVPFVAVEAGVNDLVGQAVHLAPFGQRSCFSVVLNHPGIASVAALDGWTDPAAIVWFVVTVVISPVKFQSVWWLPHVGNEVSDVVPWLTNADSPASVAGMAPRSLVIATIHHISPDNVTARVAESMLFGAMLGDLPSNLTQSASAGSRNVLSQVGGVYNCQITAIAATFYSAHPIFSFVAARSIPDNYQPAESTACQIKRARAGGFTSQAAAGFDCARRDMSPRNNLFIPALTATKPVLLPLAVRVGQSDYG